jgi:hypothetical protein
VRPTVREPAQTLVQIKGLESSACTLLTHGETQAQELARLGESKLLKIGARLIPTVDAGLIVVDGASTLNDIQHGHPISALGDSISVVGDAMGLAGNPVGGAVVGAVGGGIAWLGEVAGL